MAWGWANDNRNYNYNDNYISIHTNGSVYCKRALLFKAWWILIAVNDLINH